MVQTTTFGKGRMKLFLISQDTDMWVVITNGDFVPKTKEGAIKEKRAWSSDDKAKVLLNSKARLFFIMCINHGRK